MTVATLDIGFSKKNTEGYLDLTSYHALKKLSANYSVTDPWFISARPTQVTPRRTLSSPVNSVGLQ